MINLFYFTHFPPLPLSRFLDDEKIENCLNSHRFLLSSPPPPSLLLPEIMAAMSGMVEEVVSEVREREGGRGGGEGKGREREGEGEGEGGKGRGKEEIWCSYVSLY